MTKKEKNNRDFNKKDTLKKNQQTLLYVFIPSISAKNSQVVNVFLEEKKFTKTLNTKKKRNLIYTNLSANANYILENNQLISEQEVQKIIEFLNGFLIKVTGAVCNNQVLNLAKFDNSASYFELKQQPLIPLTVL